MVLASCVPPLQSKQLAYLVSIVLVQIYATLLSLSPNPRYAFVDVGLVYYLRYQLRHVGDRGRIGRWNFNTVDSIGRSIFNQESEEGRNLVDQEGDKGEINGEENGKATAHGCGGFSKRY